MNTTANTSYDELTWSDLIPDDRDYRVFIQETYYIFHFHTTEDEQGNSNTTVKAYPLNPDFRSYLFNTIEEFRAYITHSNTEDELMQTSYEEDFLGSLRQVA